MIFFKMVAQSKLVELLLFMMVLVPMTSSYGQTIKPKQGTDIPLMRTTYAHTTENDNGSFTTTSYSHPVNYRSKDGLLPIDLRISNNDNVRFSDYQYVNATNSFKSYFPQNINQGFLAEFASGKYFKDLINPRIYAEKDGNVFGEQKMQASIIQLKENTVLFENVYDLINLSVETDFGRRRTDYVIQSPDALDGFPIEAEYLVFEEELQLPDSWKAKLEAGMILFIEGKDSIVASYDLPILIEPNARRLCSKSPNPKEPDKFHGQELIFFALKEHNGTYILRTKINMSWLRSPQRTYPIIVDPDLVFGTKIGYITDQTWPSQYQPMLLTSAPSAPVGSTIDDVSIDITPRFFVPSDVTYSIEMFDSGANGWNGNGISLFANGSQVLSTTLPFGSTVSRFFTVGHGDLITASWTSGTAPEEVSFNIINEVDEVVFSGVFGSSIDYSVPFDNDYFLAIQNTTTNQVLWFDYYEVCIVDGTTKPILYGSDGTSIVNAGTGSNGNYGYSTDVFNGQNPNQSFSMKMLTASPDPSTRWYAAVRVTLSLTFTPPDCSALSTPGISNADNTGITYVSFNNIDNTSSATSTIVNTGITTDVCRGGSYDLNVRVNTGGNYTVLTKAWIDWNNNDVYEEASEAYVLGYATNVTDGATDAPKTILVPSDAAISTVKMRVVVAFIGTNGSYPTACDNVAWGEIEDYSVTVIKNPEITMVSPLVDNSTCGLITWPISVDASDGNGFWDTDASGAFGSLLSEANNSYTTLGVFDQDINVFWTSNVNEGVCEGSVANAVIRFNQPNSASISGDLVANQSWLWGGLNSENYTDVLNWYKWTGSYWEKSSSELPNNASDLFILSNTEAGFCVDSNHIAEITGSLSSITIGGAAEADLSGVVQVSGDIDNGGIIVGLSNSELRLMGTTDQNIGGGGTNQLYNLNVSNGTNSVVCSDPIEVSNLLDMNGGILENGNQVITIGTGSTNPGNIAYTSGVITGKLKRYFANATGSKLFPVGTSSFVRDALVDFNFSSPGIDQFLTVEFKEAVPQSGNGGGALTNGLPLSISGQDISDYSAAGYWEIEPTNGDYSSSICSPNYTIKLHMNGMQDLSDINFTRILKSSGSNSASLNHVIWSGLSAISTIGTISDFEITSITNGFSYFAAGKGSEPLPVELLSFSGDCSEGVVSLNWQTASEHNSDYFSISRSDDGNIWNEITQIGSAGFSNELLQYSCNDYPHSAMNYYRLSQIDFDGTTEVFDNDIIAVDCNSLTNDLFYTAPCPSNGGLFQLFYTMDAQQDMVFKIVSSQGRLVKSAFVQSQIGMNVWTFKEALAPGVYYISCYRGENLINTIKHIIQ